MFNIKMVEFIFIYYFVYLKNIKKKKARRGKPSNVNTFFFWLYLLLLHQCWGLLSQVLDFLNVDKIYALLYLSNLEAC